MIYPHDPVSFVKSSDRRFRIRQNAVHYSRDSRRKKASALTAADDLSYQILRHFQSKYRIIPLYFHLPGIDHFSIQIIEISNLFPINSQDTVPVIKTQLVSQGIAAFYAVL